MAAVARLGTLAFERMPLSELMEEAQRSASGVLDTEVAFDDLSLTAARALTPVEADFLAALSHVLTGAGRARLHDALTGLPNRALLEDRTTGALGRLRRGAWRVALLCIDVDRLKVLNETLGHRAGDDLLRAIGPRLSEVLRPGDTLARFGGGFAVLCEGIADEAHAARIARRIMGAFTAPFVFGGLERPVTASVGVAVAGSGQPAGTLIANAEAAMYRAKERGRARLELHDAKLRARVAARARLEDDLRRALDTDQLWLAYQPIYRDNADFALRPRELGPRAPLPACVEALVRWDHPELGGIPPSVFIPIAEESGLIVDLGRSILRAAAGAVAEWRAFAPDLGLSVNVSARQVTEPGMPELVTDVLAEFGLPADALWLELTEGVLLGDAEGTIETLEALRAPGVRLVLDDFGTGYSSLSYLRRYPIEVLKIDRSFIADEPILAAIVGMAQALGLETVAEGVETGEQLKRCTALECTYVQGYDLSRPLPAGEIERLLHVASPV